MPRSRALKEEVMPVMMKKKQVKKENDDMMEYSDVGGMNFDPKKFKMRKGKK